MLTIVKMRGPNKTLNHKKFPIEPKRLFKTFSSFNQKCKRFENFGNKAANPQLCFGNDQFLALKHWLFGSS